RRQSRRERYILKSKKLWCYIGITFALTWLSWGLMALYSNSIFVMFNSQLIIAATMWLPMVGAFVTKLIFRKEQKINLMLRPRLRGNLKIYLLALLLPSAIMLLGGAVYFAVFPRSFDAEFTVLGQLADQYASVYGGGSVSKNGIMAIVFAVSMTVAPFFNALFAVGEEIGWRGFMFPTLCEKMSPARAVIVGGIIWGLWHAPITAMGHNYGVGYWGYPITGIATMCVFCCFTGAFLSWLTQRTKSVWSAALAHGAINAVASIPIYLHRDINSASLLLGPAMVGLVGGIPMIVCGLICIKKLMKDNNNAAAAANAETNTDIGDSI
ncbi:MAG: CPBP family intramembrane glutamic endopeptidase, partial [Oscillospiraceae bacterium]